MLKTELKKNDLNHWLKIKSNFAKIDYFHTILIKIKKTHILAKNKIENIENENGSILIYTKKIID